MKCSCLVKYKEWIILMAVYVAIIISALWLNGCSAFTISASGTIAYGNNQTIDVSNGVKARHAVVSDNEQSGIKETAVQSLPEFPAARPTPSPTGSVLISPQLYVQ